MELEIIDIVFYGFCTAIGLLLIYVIAFVIIFNEYCKKHSDS